MVSESTFTYTAQARQYNRKLDVIQRGFGGYTSSHAAIMIDRLIEQESAGASKIKLLVHELKTESDHC